MTKNMQNNNEILLSDLISILWNSKLLIFSVIFLSSLAGVFYSLSLENFYKSSALVQVTSPNSGETSSAGIGGIASFAGLSIPGGLSNSRTDFAIAKLNSKEFFNALLKKHDLLPSLLATAEYDFVLNKIKFDEDIYDEELGKWIRVVSAPTLPEPSYLEAHESFLTNTFSVSLDDNSGYLILSVEHMSPFFAHDLLRIIVTELNDESRKKELVDIENSLEFLTKELLNTSTAVVSSSISKLIESQLRSKMLAYSDKDFLISYIDPPFVPERKSRPSRAMICIAFFMLGTFLSLIMAILIDAIKSYKRI
jgi:hypothetical protein